MLSIIVCASLAIGQCSRLDFNRDGVYPDMVDLQEFLTAFGGGQCPEPLMNNVIRGNFNARQAAKAYVLWSGDSISNPENSYSVASAACQNFECDFLGASVGPYLANNSWPIYSSQWTTGDGRTATASPHVRPGETIETDDVGTHNLTRVVGMYLSGDAGNFGTPVNLNVSTNYPFEGNAWDVSETMKIVAVLRKNLNSVNHWVLQYRNRSNTTIQTTTLTLNGAAAVTGYATATGDRGAGATNTLATVSTASGTEGGAGATDFQLLNWGAVCTAKTTGCFWGFCGHGSWPTSAFLVAGASVTAEAPTYTARFSDEALAANILAYRYDTFFLWIGQNDASATTYKTDVETWMARIRAAAIVAQATDSTIRTPIFVFFSPYDTSDTNAKFVSMATSLRSIAESDPACEFVDIRGYVEDEYGAWSVWQAGLLADGTHPTAEFADVLAAHAWDMLIGETTPLAGGGGASSLSMSIGLGL